VSRGQAIVARALEHGFDAAGICRPALPAADRHALEAWIAGGLPPGLGYVVRSRDVRAAGIRALFPAVGSVLVVALSYHQPEIEDDARLGLARYALGKDYHKVLRQKLLRLLRQLRASEPALDFRILVDTAPLLERAYAQAAGLGWIGKSAMLVSRELGSYTLLGAAALNLRLTPRTAFPRRRAASCGRCVACLEACPTGALVAPGRLDPRRCISYWTNEHRGEVPADAPAPHGWLFGCDRCQEVCPLNNKARPLSEPRLAARAPLLQLRTAVSVDLDDEALGGLIAGTAMTRAGVAGLRRNLARLEAEDR